MFAPPLSLCFFEPHRPPSGPSTHPLMPSRQQQTVAKRGDDRLARARAFRNPPTGAKRARKQKKLATSPRAVLKFVESLGLVAPPRVLLGPFQPLDFRCSSFRRPYEAPRGARGTYGRAKTQRFDWNGSQRRKNAGSRGQVRGAVSGKTGTFKRRPVQTGSSLSTRTRRAKLLRNR